MQYMEIGVWAIAVEVAGLLGVGGIISGLVVRRLNRMDKRMADQEKRRIDETVLILKGIESIGDLSEATATAVKTGHANGEVTAAVESYRGYKKEWRESVIRGSAENVVRK